jgi:hypothetical protein
MTTDPLRLAHRIHVTTTTDGYRAVCTCGWSVVRRTRELRQRDVDAHTMDNLLPA